MPPDAAAICSPANQRPKLNASPSELRVSPPGCRCVAVTDTLVSPRGSRVSQKHGFPTLKRPFRIHFNVAIIL